MAVGPSEKVTKPPPASPDDVGERATRIELGRMRTTSATEVSPAGIATAGATHAAVVDVTTAARVGRGASTATPPDEDPGLLNTHHHASSRAPDAEAFQRGMLDTSSTSTLPPRAWAKGGDTAETTGRSAYENITELAGGASPAAFTPEYVR